MTTPQEPKFILLFVDNYYAEPTAWHSLEELIAKDSELNEQFIVRRFSFSSSLRLNEITQRLAETINQECQHTELVLVGHGLGTVIIFNYLSQLLRPHATIPDLVFQQIILFAPIIHKTSRRTEKTSFYQQVKNKVKILSASFTIMYRLMDKEKALQVDIDQLCPQITEHMINQELVPNKLPPIPMFAICGLEDEFVNANEVADYFGLDNQQSISGNHLTLTEADNPESNCWNVFRKALLHPYGHRHTLLVRSLKLDVTLKPGTNQWRIVKKEQTDSRLIEDHVGTVHYLIDMASNNTCRSRFQISYSVQKNAYIDEVYKSYEKLDRTTPFNRSTFERDHTTYHSEFDYAKVSNPSELKLEVINGFNDAQFKTADSSADSYRPELNFYVPFFLGKGDRHYKQVTLLLDLRPFDPEQLPPAHTLGLHWLPDEVDPNLTYPQLMNKFSGIGTRLTYAQTELAPGCWQFTTRNFRYGTLVLTWVLQN